MDEFIRREEHDEFARRMEEEHRRTNKRLENVEENIRQIGELTASVREMAVSMKNMANEQGKMVDRIDNLEAEPRKNWSALKTGLLSALAGSVATAIIAAVVNYIR